MDNETFLVRVGHRITRHYRRVLLLLCIYLFLILIKNLFIVGFDASDWFKKPLVYATKLLEWSGLIGLIIALVSRIPYIRVPIIWIGITCLILLAVELSCLCLVEWKNRPGAPEETESATPGRPGLLHRLFMADEVKSETKSVPNYFKEKVPAADLDVQMLPLDFESKKLSGSPVFSRSEPNYHDWQVDGVMGYINRPNFRGVAQTWSYGIQNPPANYTTDSLGRRITGNDIKTPRKKYAMFLGCSITFGVMVDDCQNLPSIFERLDTNYRCYNYGVSGYGTHHLLSLFETRNLRKEVEEKDGVAFYIFFPGHINRAIGDMETYLSWNNNGPYYYLDGDEVKRNKDFKTGRVVISRFYEILHTTYFCKYFDIRLPGKLRDHHYRFTAKLIEKACKNYQEQFGNNHFYVVLSPGWDNKILPYLEKLNLSVIDYSENKLAPYWNDQFQFSGDGHPRPQMYKIIAEKLKEDIDR